MYERKTRWALVAPLLALAWFTISAEPRVSWYEQQQAGTAAAGRQAAPGAQPATASLAQKRELRGVPNFGEVSPTLYRGGQPSGAGVEELKRFGIEMIVNFRDEKGTIENERRQVESLGMTYVSIPWRASDQPDAAQVAQFFVLLDANPGKKIFVHCHYGADRTGVMLAAHRIAQFGWTPEQAYAEMRAFSFHRFWYGHLKSYVFAFPETYSTHAAFAALRPAAPQPTCTSP